MLIGMLIDFPRYFRASRGSRRCQAASKVVSGGPGKPRALEGWPESSGKSLDNDFPIEAFSCQVWLFSVLLGRLQVTLEVQSWEEEKEKEEEEGEEPESKLQT